jgi:APA family basic amino acid/polyamine antiporter
MPQALCVSLRKPTSTLDSLNTNVEQNNRPYGLTTLTFLVVASMIGAGVFTTSGFTLGAVGSANRVMLCWMIGGVIAMCGAHAYGQLARVIPLSGGEYLYLSRNVHPLAGFLAGWVSLTAGFTGAIATAAISFESYIVPKDARPDWLPPDVVAIALVVACCLLHALRVKLGSYIQNNVVAVKLLILLGFVIYAWPTSPASHPILRDAPDTSWDLTLAMATSVVWISLSYAGFNAAIYVASECRHAERNVPKALLLGTALVTLLYLALNWIFVKSAAPDVLAFRPDVAAAAAESIGGARLELLIRVTVALGLYSSVSGMIMAGPRVYSRMADDGVFPRLFSIDATAGGQGIGRAIIMQTVLSVALILLQRILVHSNLIASSLQGLLTYLGTTLSLTSAFCVATLFLPSVRARLTKPHSVLASITAAVYVVATCTAVALMVMTHSVDDTPQGLWHLTGTLVTVVTGLIAWSLFRPRSPQPANEH